MLVMLQLLDLYKVRFYISLWVTTNIGPLQGPDGFDYAGWQQLHNPYKVQIALN